MSVRKHKNWTVSHITWTLHLIGREGKRRRCVVEPKIDQLSNRLLFGLHFSVCPVFGLSFVSPFFHFCVVLGVFSIGVLMSLIFLLRSLSSNYKVTRMC